jgi:hypothetical protein
LFRGDAGTDFRKFLLLVLRRVVFCPLAADAAFAKT